MLLGEKGKMKQFEQLLMDAETNATIKTGEAEDKTLSIGEDDLQGFWDLLNFQIMDIKEKFQRGEHDHNQNELSSSSSSSSQQIPATAVVNDKKNPPTKKNSQSSKSNGKSNGNNN